MGQNASSPSDYDLYQPKPHLFSLSRLDVVRRVEASLGGTASEDTIISVSAPSSARSSNIAIQGGAAEAEIAFICDPDAKALSRDATLLKVVKGDDLQFRFRFRVGRQDGGSVDQLAGLSFVTAESRAGMERLLRVERQIDPNLSNRPNVVVLPSAQREAGEQSLTWQFVPPPGSERRGGGGHRVFGAFASFDANENDFDILASFCIYVEKAMYPTTPSLIAGLNDSQLSPASHASRRFSHNDGAAPSMVKSATSPNLGSDAFPSTTPTAPLTPSIYDETEFDDGPLFRATLAGLEKRCAALRKSIKGVLRGFEGLHETLETLQEQELRLDEALASVDEHSPAAYRPLKEAYMQEARLYLFALGKERTQRLAFAAMEPLRRMSGRLKEVESRKKLFESESRTYYDYVNKYLSIKSDAASEGPSKESKADERFTAAKNRFALARISYHHALYDCAVFQEVETLYALTQFASTQHDLYTLGTESGRSLSALGGTLGQLQEELERSKAECALRRAGLEEHRRAFETKVALSEVNAADLSRLSLDVTSAKNAQSGSMGLASPPSKSHELGERLRDFATTLGMRKDPTGDQRAEDGKRHRRNKPSLGKLPPPASTIAHSAVPLSPSALNPPRLAPPTPQVASASQARKKEGFLYACNRATSHQSNAIEGRTWHKYWTVLAGGMLSEYTGWREGLELHGTPIDLRFASAREARNAERRFCFEVLTPSMRRVYQATSDADVKDWIRAISASIESLLNGTSTVRNVDAARMKAAGASLQPLSEVASRAQSSGNSSFADVEDARDSPGMSFAARLIRTRSSAKRRSVGARLTGKPDPKGGRNALGRLPEGSRSLGSLDATLVAGEDGRRSVSDAAAPDHGGASGSSTAEDTSDEVDDFDRGIAQAVRSLAGSGPRNRHSMPSPPVSKTTESKARNAEELEELVRLPGNSVCAECDEPNPRWASWSLGVFVCIRCSGIHRSLGTHISKVRSVDLDDWSDEQMAMMRDIGNARSNAVWEARLPPGFIVTKENVGAFIRNKYCDGLYRAAPPVLNDTHDEEDALTPTFTRFEHLDPGRARQRSTQGLLPVPDADPVFAAHTFQRGQHVRAQSYAGVPQTIHQFGKAL